MVNHVTEDVPAEDADAVVLANRLLHKCLIRYGCSKTCLFTVSGEINSSQLPVY